MKKVILSIFLVLVCVQNVFAYDASDTGWKITDYDSQITIETNRKITVEETLKVDFANLDKHGIYRWFPLSYTRNGNNYNVRISDVSVTNAEGEKINYTKDLSDGKIELKIGDKDKIVSGNQTYKIKYSLERVINSFSDSDEFYWNVTGEDWPVDIEKVSATVIWPQDAKIKQNICYLGVYGSNSENCLIDIKNNKVTFSANDTLFAGEGFTIVSSVNQGIIKQYSIWQTIVWFFQDNWGYLIPIVVFVLLFQKYLKNGRDPKGKTTIVPEFSPPINLRPAVMGTIFDENVDTKDIAAVIIDLAVNGYIKIKETKEKKLIGEKTEYIFINTYKEQTKLANYEKKIMQGLFSTNKKEVKLSDLKNKFYKHVPDIRKDLYDIVKTEDYFVENPDSVRNKYLIVGIIMICSFPIVIPACAMINSYSSLPFIIAFMLSGLFFVIFAFVMPKRTEKGVEATRLIKGFKLYMHTAERYRQKFNEDNQIFEKYLPYAMVFGTVKEWSNKFRDMQIAKPEWYDGPGVFYPWIFADTIDHMQTGINASMTAPSQAGSGGSGFSGGGVGGGFGGGGGGSW